MNTNLLKAELSKRNMSVDELADSIGVNRTTIYRLLKGETVCSVRIAAKIINAMKLKPKTATLIFFEDEVTETEQHAPEESKNET